MNLGKDSIYNSKLFKVVDSHTYMQKYRDPEWVQSKFDEGLERSEIADICGVAEGTIAKWIAKLNIGKYECPWDGCDIQRPTEVGIKRHHAKVHGESIAQYKFECKNCGKIQFSNRKQTVFCDQECNSEYMEGPMSDERKEAISQGMKQAYREGRHSGHNTEWIRKNIIEQRNDEYLHEPLSQEVRDKISESHIELVECGESPMQSEEFESKRAEERRKRINDNNTYFDNSENARKAARISSGRNSITVDKTGNVVDSSLEKEIDILLHENGIDYTVDVDVFNIDDSEYKADFQVDNIIIEVKGLGGYIHKPDRIERIAEYMTNIDDIIYIVVGTVELESDVFISWDNRKQLLSHIS